MTISGKDSIKLLILSYHYLPMNVIASYRPAGFTQHLYKYGIYPTVLTHRWELDVYQKWISHNKGDQPIIEENDKYRVIRIPLYHTFLGNLFRFLEKTYLSRQLLFIFRTLLGYLDPCSKDADSYIAYKRFLFKHLQYNSYDMVIGIYSPNHHIRLCSEIYNRFNIQYSIDLRDIWIDNRIARIGYRPNLRNQYQDYVHRLYWKKWFKKASFFTITSSPWRDILQHKVEKNGYVITNGFDDIFSQRSKIRNDKFTISHIGTIYPEQDIESLFQALEKIFIANSEVKINLNIIGIKPWMEKRIESGITKFSLKGIVNYKKRIPRDDAIQIMLNSEVLYYPTWPNVPGTYSGKIFEYLASENKILAFPDDHSVINELLNETNSGVVVNSVKELSVFIDREYKKWLTTNETKSDLSFPSIAKYSRGHQTSVLANLIRANIEKKQ